MAGKLRLLGSFTVRQVVLASVSGKPAEAQWDAPEYLLAHEESSTALHFREVPLALVHKLRFVSKHRPAVAFNADGTVNGQTLRAVRELTPQSATIFESLLQQGGEASDSGERDRLALAVLNKATPQHVWWAVQPLLSESAQHFFGESVDYDPITDEGQRLPPKAVFGIALSRALGWEVLPKHFTVVDDNYLGWSTTTILAGQ